MADFKNGSNQSIEYSYDKNGNLTKNLNKGLPIISYNSLNLLVSLSIANASGSATNSYTYSADDRKLKVEMKYGALELARDKPVRSKMLNASVGRVPNVTEAGGSFTTNRTLKNDEEEKR